MDNRDTDAAKALFALSASKHLKYDHSAPGWIPVVSADVNDYCYIVVTDIDDEAPENIGINKLVFITEKARCAADFEHPQKSGLWIFDDPPDKDGKARWIGFSAEDGAVTSVTLMSRSYHANGIP